MLNIFFKNVSFLGVGLSATAAFFFLWFKGWIWSTGIMTGGLWVFANSFFLYQLLEISLNPALESLGKHSSIKGGVNPRPKQQNKILVFSVLKFPVLYLAGFFILSSDFFPVYSLLTGVTLYFTALGVVWIRFNLASAQLQGKRTS